MKNNRPKEPLAIKQRNQRKKWSEERRNKDKEYRKKYWLDNKEILKKKNKEFRFRQLYNISLEEHENLRILQNNCCKLCGKKDKQLVIDHNHETGKVRGLLCYGCNNGLGQFEDSKEFLQKAIKYLQENN